MATLKTAFEDAGMDFVSTYINSGNIIFRDDTHSLKDLAVLLESVIKREFHLEIKVLLRTIAAMRNVVKALPDTWTNDQLMKSDVLFLWEDVDSEEAIRQIGHNPDIDTVIKISGAILFSVSRQNATKSALQKIVGLPFYKKMTVRNCNTTRKILEIMEKTEKLSRS